MGGGEWESRGLIWSAERWIGASQEADRRYHRSVDKYRSLAAWQSAHSLVLLTLRTTDRAVHPRHYALFDQLRRAAISVEANVVEGYALGSTPQFRRHLWIAYASAAEAECLVRTAREMSYLRADAAGEIEALAGRAMRTIRGLINKSGRGG